MEEIESDIVKQKQLRDAQENQEFDRDMDAYRRGRELTDEQRKKILLDNAAKKKQTGLNLKAEIAGVGFETSVNVATDALTAALGWAPPVYAVVNFLSAGGANLVAQKMIRGKEDINWG